MRTSPFFTSGAPQRALTIATQSTVAPLSFATFDHLADSARTNLVKFSGMSASSYEPVSARTLANSGDFMNLMVSALILSIVAFGVLAGANRPYQA